MLSIEATAARFCDGITRRDFLRIGSLASLGVSLPQLLRSRDSQAAERVLGNGASGTFGQAKRCILLYMWGGPPHHDTFDPKPDAPVQVRGEFRAARTNVAGMFISDHLPLLAQQADKYTIIRSMTHTNGDHISAAHDLLTGNVYPRTSPIVTARPTDHPHYGAVLAHLKPTHNGLPSYVQLPCLLRSNSGKVIPGQNGGFFGRGSHPFLVDAVPNKAPSHDPRFKRFTPTLLRLREGISLGRLTGRHGLVDTLNRHFHTLEKNRVYQGFDSVHQQAFSLLSSTRARRAFDLSAESSRKRDRYPSPAIFRCGDLVDQALDELMIVRNIRIRCPGQGVRVALQGHQQFADILLIEAGLANDQYTR